MSRIRQVVTFLAAMTACVAAAAALSKPEGDKLSEWVTSKPHPSSVDVSKVPSIDVSILDDELRTLVRTGQLGDSEASRSGYRLTYLPDEKVLLYEDPTHHHPSVVLHQEPALDLIVESPHAGLETGTAYEAAYLLRTTGARALVLSGMHRCALSTYSSCDGLTAVCGSSEAYRTSDAAHSADGLFQKIHEVLTRLWPKSIVLQLHEMRPSEMGEMVILSSTAHENAPKDGLVASLRTALKRRLQDEVLVFSCHNPDDLEKGFRLLCGYTNVQGRLLNGSRQPCTEDATSSGGRFIHIEQDYRITSDPHYLEAFGESIREILSERASLATN